MRDAECCGITATADPNAAVTPLLLFPSLQYYHHICPHYRGKPADTALFSQSPSRNHGAIPDTQLTAIKHRDYCGDFFTGQMPFLMPKQYQRTDSVHHYTNSIYVKMVWWQPDKAVEEWSPSAAMDNPQTRCSHESWHIVVERMETCLVGSRLDAASAADHWSPNLPPTYIHTNIHTYTIRFNVQNLQTHPNSIYWARHWAWQTKVQ